MLGAVWALASCGGRSAVPVDGGEGSTRDATPSPEGGYACPAPHFGVSGCRESGGGCQSWAERVGAGWVDPIASCFAPNERHSYCLRADSASLFTSVNGCGSGPPCEVYQVCARRAAGAPYECLPCTSN